MATSWTAARILERGWISSSNLWIAILRIHAATSPSPRQLSGFSHTAMKVFCSTSSTTPWLGERRDNHTISHGACRS